MPYILHCAGTRNPHRYRDRYRYRYRWQALDTASPRTRVEASFWITTSKFPPARRTLHSHSVLPAKAGIHTVAENRRPFDQVKRSVDRLRKP